MMRRGVVGLALGALLLAGCVESDIRTEIKEDGTGSLRMSAKMTEGMVKLMKRMEKAGGGAGGMNVKKSDMKIEKPDEATLKKLADAGLRIEEVANTDSDTEFSLKVRVAFDRLSALSGMGAIAAKGAGGEFKPADIGKGLRLTKNDAGIYTLSFGMNDAAGGGGDGEPVEEAEEAPPAGPPEGGLTRESEKEAAGEGAGAEAKEPAAGEAKEGPAEPEEDPMALMGEMMEEMQNMKIAIGFAVPGEIVDFAPETGGEKKAGEVTWTLDMGTMMAIQMEGVDTFQVRFKMPEGKSLPESALWTGKSPAATTTPAPGPAPAPAGGAGEQK